MSKKATQEHTKIKTYKRKTILDKPKALFKKYYDVIAYLFFGVCTTIINIATFELLFSLLHINELISNIIAWIASVAFAYITNRKWVFKSEAHGKKEIIREIASFTSARLATGLLDMLIIFIFITLLKQPSIIVKTASNVLVIVLNYVASKLFIFKKPKATK